MGGFCEYLPEIRDRNNPNGFDLIRSEREKSSPVNLFNPSPFIVFQQVVISHMPQRNARQNPIEIKKFKLNFRSKC